MVKNKIAPPFREAEFDIMFDSGISYEGDLLDLGCTCGVLTKSGAWLLYGETKLGQGKENARKLLIEDKKLTKEIADKILVTIGVKEK